MTGCITVKLRYADFTNTSKQEVIDYTALDDELMLKAKDLFNKLYEKGEKVRLIGVRFSDLIPITIQTNLFDESAEKLQLFKTVDEIKTQFGLGAVVKARHLPGKTE